MTTLLAFFATPCPDYSVIVFAESRGKAKVALLATPEMEGYEYPDIRLRRVPEFDEYAGSGEVPLAAELAKGWWFPCRDCGSGEFTQESIAAGEAVVDGEDVYCRECAGKRGGRG